MSLKTPAGVEDFQDLLQESFEASLQDDGLSSWRSRAWDRFLELGLPTTKKENYQYVPLRRLYSTEFQLAERTFYEIENVSDYIFEECQESNLVFVDGFFSPELSNITAIKDQIVILPFEEAMQSYGVLMQNHWNKALLEEKDAFCLLNMALHTDGLFIYLPPNRQVKRPVQVLQILTSSQNPLIVSPRMELFLGKNAEMQITARTVSLGVTQDWCNQKWGIVLEENARLILSDSSALSDERIYTSHVRGLQKRNSYLKVVNFSDGARFAQNDYQTTLAEPGANVELFGLWMLEKARENHTHIQVTHAAPHCESRQFFKGILDGESKASFEGKIYVHPEAQKTQAYQLNRNLILSNDAKTYSKPNLEIFADDVKASHGATVTQLSEESLFYLQSRGLTRSQAKAFLIQAFWKEMIEYFPASTWKSWTEDRCKELFNA